MLTTMCGDTQNHLAVKVENQIYPDKPSLACESNVYLAMLYLLPWVSACLAFL